MEPYKKIHRAPKNHPNWRLKVFFFLSFALFASTPAMAEEANQDATKAVQANAAGIETAAQSPSEPKLLAESDPEFVGPLEADPQDDATTAYPLGVGLGASAPGGVPATVGGGHNLRLRGIEEKVDALKERIFRSKARLLQLQEVVFQGSMHGARVRIVHENQMGAAFSLWRVQYALDETPIFNRVVEDVDADANLDDVVVFDGNLAPGAHRISVFLEYRGNGLGIFSYLDGYVFKLKSGHSFEAQTGKKTEVRVVGFERKNPTIELQDRPSVRYDLNIMEQESLPIKNTETSFEESKDENQAMSAKTVSAKAMQAKPKSDPL